ncbi:hypothetical protein [Penaeicola halotolerans]|uniref:hypothetical protein n=1 Tax=Penaeicola halotolerans TaxID=2793196 RepID=UPI001CF82B30|nr:hypothetical protein [Penaeicola halotolerans]
MNLKRNLYLILSLLTVAGIIYAYLGGFDTPSITIVENTTLQAEGITYTGEQKDEAIAELFKTFQKSVAAGKADALCTIYYLEPNDDSDSTQLFIGQLAPLAPADTLEQKTFQAAEWIVVELTSHPIVRPHPGKIDELIQEKAQSLQKSVIKPYLELYFPDETLKVYARLK